MTTSGTAEIVAGFAGRIADELVPEKLDGPVHLDPTRTVVIIPLKDRGPIHAYVRHGLSDESVADVMKQLRAAPSLKPILKSP